ncbi:hypothetical protein [Pulveribacter suum]|uniref:hypothetical protein n=1 Tax=Pulveribacter suum TaxID=2116657 RepID=UPI001300A87A|nr:hypothetical protein [Pulveribacter suum]
MTADSTRPLSFIAPPGGYAERRLAELKGRMLESLPAALQASLPSIKQIESEP